MPKYTRTKCEVCLGTKKTRKRIPYGSQLKSMRYCGCDGNQTDEVSKTKARRQAKQEITKTLNEVLND